MNNIKTIMGATAAIAVLLLIGGFFFWQNTTPNTVAQVEPAASETDTEEQVEPITSQPNVETEITDEQLIEAVIAKDSTAVAQLLDAGISPNISDSAGNPILKSIIFDRTNEGTDIIALLIKHGANVNVPDSEGNALLPMATYAGQLEVVQLLLDAGADANGTMTTSNTSILRDAAVGSSALMEATLQNHIEIVELLLAHDANVNYTEKAYNRTVLHVAAHFNNTEIINLLIESGADLNPRSTLNDAGETPIYWAARRGYSDAVEILINAGANIDTQTTDRGLTPLMRTLEADSNSVGSEVITLLLERGTNPNLQDNNGDTALHYAVRFRRLYAIPLLIEHDADLELQNNNGDMALDIAIAKDNTEAIGMLREAGAGG